ncbi:MAG: CDP-alcohol phosphatidyltransferase family protein [Bradymonadaceae bacterium]
MSSKTPSEILIAVIDTTGHPDDVPPEAVVGGLTLLERALRLAEVGGFDRIIVLSRSSSHPEIGALIGHHQARLPIDNIAAPSLQMADRVRAVARAISETEAGISTRIVWYSSSTVYERRLLSAAQRTTPGTIARASASKTGLVRDLAGFSPEAWQIIVSEVIDDENPTSIDELVDGAARRGIDVRVHDEDGWTVPIEGKSDALRAVDSLWQSCRKDADGIVSRHINRHISLGISRRIAHTGITPNHISIFTFSLGILAAVIAAVGGYWAFLIAGLIYQINSVVDGVDGELARVKYEFSLVGEWLDTLSDDFSDLFIYIGLGIGAWRTVDFPMESIGPEIWLMLGGLAAVGKVVSMVLYYRWLIAHKRGDLLAFQWSFEDESDTEPSALTRALQSTKYLFKKDFIVFAAMLLGIVGALPWLLVALGPGNLIVAVSVALQSTPDKG